MPNLQLFTGLQLCQCEQNWLLPVLDKVTVFLKGYDVITSVYGVTNKIFSRDSIHLVDLVKLPTSHNYRNFCERSS